MADDADTVLRTTQRAPKSCQSCASRKVKCNKSVPCSTCIRRGEAEKCARETVIVRGEVTRAEYSAKTTSYQDLMRENERLRSALTAQTNRSRVHQDIQTGPLRKLRKPQHLLECHDVLEEVLFEPPSATKRRARIHSWEQIRTPSRRASEGLVAYDEKWNSWVHYALEYPHFHKEHAEFMESIDRGVKLMDYDPAWLSVYFSVITAALLMMDSQEASSVLGPDHQEILENWYEAALFCLGQSELMRTSNIRVVQAVAVLGICFYNFGDAELSQHLWSCAIRIAQNLGLDGSRPGRTPKEIGQEAQCRLWWTLMICEWLVVPYHVPQVDEGDFDVALPSMDPGSGLPGGLQPVQYHIFMARSSIVYHRFRSALREGTRPVSEVVRLADEELAEVINTLPEHLHPDGGKNEEMNELEGEHPWIKWQRFDISLVLLYHRMRINRSLQRDWKASPGQHEWARTVCIRSAMDIIWIIHNWDQPAAMKRHWPFSSYIFVAVIFLLRESCAGGSGEHVDFSDEVRRGIEYLDEVKSHNAIAYRAAAVLRRSVEQLRIGSLEP
ncbi:hypothetical protein CMUS01_06642 [Colletotrichum musicola]|uniref:Zn(2)-C6 fungal-type domain-containing protein n=1 Tax=Colletotrichum musicola TaxID=2175873 RepID=A0A8H6NI18_9PEZI|nr:hypothetical protein CMUS01_06642 [Colletotrichum musicola]